MGVAQDDEGTKARVGEPAGGCRVFVSYRRADSADATDRLADALTAHFGSGRIFLDIDNIELGADFAQTIENWVASCDALVVVIGPRWATATDRAGKRRLDDPHDYVRLEVEAGLRRGGVRVIPVMIHGAEMPLAEELPESLQPLRRRNALQIDRKNWHYDIARLCKTLERIEARPDELSRTPAPPTSAAVPAQVGKGVSSSPTSARCLKCGTVNEAGATYCCKCGFSLFDDTLAADRPIRPPRARHLEVVLEPTAVKLLPGQQARMFARASDSRPDPDLRWELAGAAAGLATLSKATTGVQIALHPGTDEPPARMPLDVHCFERDELVGEAHGTVEVLEVELAAPALGKDTSRPETETGEVADGAQVPPTPDAREDHHRLGREDVGRRVRARITAGSPSGEAASSTPWSATVTARDAPVPARERSAGPTHMRAAGAIAAGGTLLVMVSLLLPGLDDHTPFQRYQRFAIWVTCICVALLVLIGAGVRSHRRGPLLAATGLAFALLGEALPLSWFHSSNHAFVSDSGYHAGAGFWLGVCGATLAAVGAAFTWWLTDADTPRTGGAAGDRTVSPIARTVLVMAGPLIVIGALFLNQFGSGGTTIWLRWNHYGMPRYPLAVVLLCGVLGALAVAGIRVNRRRLLVMAAAVGLLVVGETFPLLHKGTYGGYGPGFWLGAVGAVVAFVGLVLAAAATSRDAVVPRDR
jgi:TIR domain